MENGTLEIHSENILPIIKKWLYSDKDIFVRELISNSCDAIQKVKILRDAGEVAATDEEFRIDVQIDKEKRQLKFSDNGIGMTSEEVKKYIAQIAFSGAEEFLSKCQSNDEKDQIIGHFGLGFFSAYMVADKVEINTLSYQQSASAVRWISDGSKSYEIGAGDRTDRGTTLILSIGKDHEECLDTNHIEKILKQYCSFLPYPIYLDDKKINTQEPLWIKSPSECTDEDYLNFYRYLYPHEEPPLFWIHLNVDYPFHLKGILFFPKVQKDFDPNKSSVSLYCNRVFVSDNCKDLIPNYLMVLKGIIDSPDIPLNVSRSYLQMDRTVRQLASHISKKVSDSLSLVYRNDRERYIKVWPDVSLVVKLGVLEDEKFYERVKDILIWQTADDKWLTLTEYLEQSREKNGEKVFYTNDQKHASHILEIYQQKEIPVICTNSPLDSYLINYLENKISPATFQRIDSEMHDHILDKTREKSIVDEKGQTEATKLAELIKEKLAKEGVEVEAKSLAADHLPAVIVIDEKQRRMRDYFLRMDPSEKNPQMNFFGNKKFIVNTNNALILGIEKLNAKNPELAKELTLEVYELALLSQREMDPQSLNEFISRSNKILQELTQEAVKSL